LYDVKFSSVFVFRLNFASKSKNLNHLPSILYSEKPSDFSQILLKERFLQNSPDKMKKNIESRAKNESLILAG